MEEFKPNSHKAKEEAKSSAEKKVEKVVSGKATTRKKSGASKFANAFFSEDISNVKSYILTEVIIPAAKKTISDIVTNGIDMILYGEAGRTKKTSNASKISYREYYDRPSRSFEELRARSVFNYDDITFDNKADASDVLSRMYDLIDLYGEVSVADMYDMSGVTAPHTFNNYGWTRLSTADIVRLRDGGWGINLPNAKPLR